ncbi:MAG: glycogen-binding domain-containing protein [Desulfatiglandales bacterium]
MATKKKRVEFKMSAPDAEQVLLAGSFNQWSEKPDVMKRDKTGVWKKIKILPRGTYEYKFIVDGRWTIDPNCPDTNFNRYGTENNWIEV